MTSMRTFWRNLLRPGARTRAAEAAAEPQSEPAFQIVDLDLELPPNDPLSAFLSGADGVVDVEDMVEVILAWGPC